jgi:hypothetical protein
MQQLNNSKNYRRRPATHGNRSYHNGGNGNGNRGNHGGHKGEFRPADLAQLQMAAPVVTVGSKLYQQAVQRSEHYVGKAKDAMSSGDRFAAEGFLQHADHYGRIILEANELNREQKERQQPQRHSQPVHGSNPPGSSSASSGSEESQSAPTPSSDEGASTPSSSRPHRTRRGAPSSATASGASSSSNHPASSGQVSAGSSSGSQLRRAPRGESSADQAAVESLEGASLPLPPPLRIFSETKKTDESAL